MPTPTPTPTIQSNLGWEEAPVAAGNWRYVPRGRVPAASFGVGENDDRIVIACPADTRRISLLVIGAQAQAQANQPVMVRTSFGALSWSGTAAPAASYGPAGLLITRPATDPGLDQIAYSRGRISIEVPGSARLIVPVWAEISRVIEDCRN